MFGEVPLEDKVKFLSYLCELRGSQSNTTPKNIKFIEVSLFPYHWKLGKFRLIFF